jgi:hypothetical protein
VRFVIFGLGVAATAALWLLAMVALILGFTFDDNRKGFAVLALSPLLIGAGAALLAWTVTSVA